MTPSFGSCLCALVTPFILLRGATVVVVGSGSVHVVLKKRNVSKLTNKKKKTYNNGPNDGLPSFGPFSCMLRCVRGLLEKKNRT